MGRSPVHPDPARGAATVNTDQIRDLALDAALAASAKKATDIVILDVGSLLGITDYFVLVSAGNERQLGTVVEEIEHRLKRDHAYRVLRREGSKEAGWLVLDYGDFVVHAFSQEQREFYGLERLWADADVVPFADPAEVGSS